MLFRSQQQKFGKINNHIIFCTPEFLENYFFLRCLPPGNFDLLDTLFQEDKINLYYSYLNTPLLNRTYNSTSNTLSSSTTTTSSSKNLKRYTILFPIFYDDTFHECNLKFNFYMTNISSMGVDEQLKKFLFTLSLPPLNGTKAYSLNMNENPYQRRLGTTLNNNGDMISSQISRIQNIFYLKSKGRWFESLSSSREIENLTEEQIKKITLIYGIKPYDIKKEDLSLSALDLTGEPKYIQPERSNSIFDNYSRILRRRKNDLLEKHVNSSEIKDEQEKKFLYSLIGILFISGTCGCYERHIGFPYTGNYNNISDNSFRFFNGLLKDNEENILLSYNLLGPLKDSNQLIEKRTSKCVILKIENYGDLPQNNNYNFFKNSSGKVKNFENIENKIMYGINFEGNFLRKIEPWTPIVRYNFIIRKNPDGEEHDNALLYSQKTIIDFDPLQEDQLNSSFGGTSTTSSSSATTETELFGFSNDFKENYLAGYRYFYNDDTKHTLYNNCTFKVNNLQQTILQQNIVTP